MLGPIISILQAQATYKLNYPVSFTIKQSQILPALLSHVHPGMPLIWGQQTARFVTNQYFLAKYFIRSFTFFTCLFMFTGKLLHVFCLCFDHVSKSTSPLLTVLAQLRTFMLLHIKSTLVRSGETVTLNYLH